MNPKWADEVRRRVAEAPPLSKEQQDTLAMLLARDRGKPRLKKQKGTDGRG